MTRLLITMFSILVIWGITRAFSAFEARIIDGLPDFPELPDEEPERVTIPDLARAA